MPSASRERSSRGGIKFYQKKNCVAVPDGIDSDFPNVVIEIVDTVDRTVSVTEDGRSKL